MMDICTERESVKVSLLSMIHLSYWQDILLICSQGLSETHNYLLKLAITQSLIQTLFITTSHVYNLLSHIVTLNMCFIISRIFCLLACVCVDVCKVVGLWIMQTQLASDLTLAQCVGLGRTGLQLRLPAPHRLRQRTKCQALKLHAKVRGQLL